MGERYKPCKACKESGLRLDPVLLIETECGFCGGQGFLGDAIDLYEKSLREDWDREVHDRGEE